LKPALLPRSLLPLHRPRPAPRTHPGTPRDPLLSQYPVISINFRCFPLRHRKTIRAAFRLCQALFCFVLIILYSMIPPVQEWISPDRNRPVQSRSSPRYIWTGIGPIPDADSLDWAWSGLIPHCVQG
jgi:hypothetical protein